MVRKLAVGFALGAALLGAVGKPASAQAVRIGAYVAGPPVVIEVPVAPGPDYIWVPQYHRWYPRAYFYGRRFEYGRRFDRYRYYDRDHDRDGWRR
jgi:hypothetical protein